MATETHGSLRERERGFTLAEVLAALAILLIGVTALLAALGASVSQRRSTDARQEVTALVEAVMHRVQNEAVRSTNGGSSPFDLEFVPLTDQPAAGFPGLTWSATAVDDKTRPELWMVRIVATWLENGEPVTVEFLRILPKQLPLRDRVLSFRETKADGAAR